MPMMAWISACAALVLLAVVVAGAARRRLTAGRDLPAPLSVAIWCAWALHAALVLVAVLTSTWDLALGVPGDLLGALLVAGGAVLYVGGLGAFGSLARVSGTTSDRVISGGVYRVSRHPQYVGWALALAGAGLVGSSALALLLVGALLALLAWYLPVEERGLAAQHGEAYRRYARNAPRLLGRPR